MNLEIGLNSGRKHITEVELDNKLVFARMDFNVPLNDEGKITDDTRITAGLETLRYLQEHQARTVVASHLGRPKGKVVPAMSLAPVRFRLEELLETEVGFVEELSNESLDRAKQNLKPGQFVLLENVRFHPGEKKNDQSFIDMLARGVELYVNDAFGTCHRNQASVTGVATRVPVAVTGFLVRKEIDTFARLLGNPAHPFVAILGGAKVSDKIEVIEKLIETVDMLLIGGGMAYTFLKSQGINVGNSLVENDHLNTALKLMNEAKDMGIELYLPVDNVVANKMDDEVKTSVVKNENIPWSWMALDIGPETTQIFSEKIKSAKTIFWNGPMGVFEKQLFRKGTLGLARAIAESSAVSVVGGGDSVAAVKMFHLESEITHLSTGGGASMELIQGKLLPGIAALTKNE